MSDTLKQRLADALPMADEREFVWCSVQGHDLRAAVGLIESQAAENIALRKAAVTFHRVVAEQAADISRLTTERDAIRELMSVYNLGGWTDAIAPMKRALKAEAECDALAAAGAELVACKELKEWMTSSGSCGESFDGKVYEAGEARADYERRKPLAWAAMRAALAARTQPAPIPDCGEAGHPFSCGNAACIDALAARAQETKP